MGSCWPGWRPSNPDVVARSSSCQTVKSRCSVKAIAGSPSATARVQALIIDAESAVSHDHSVCTWLSGGRIAPILRYFHRLWSGYPVLSSPLPTVGRVSTAVAPTGLSASVGEEALAVLRELTGRPDAVFREGQDVAVAALVEQAQRALVVQRTGWGKSAVYFVSTALLRRRCTGPTLLVSPLLALMRDQV